MTRDVCRSVPSGTCRRLIGEVYVDAESGALVRVVDAERGSSREPRYVVEPVDDRTGARFARRGADLRPYGPNAPVVEPNGRDATTARRTALERRLERAVRLAWRWRNTARLLRTTLANQRTSRRST